MEKETRDKLLDIQLSNYINKKCIFCRHIFVSIADIKKYEIIFAGKNVHSKDLYACKVCWNNHIKQGDAPKQEGVTE